MERVEKCKDMQLLREFVFVMPLELNLDQNITLASEFVQDTFANCHSATNNEIFFQEVCCEVDIIQLH